MTSRKRSPDRPIKFATLKIAFKADKKMTTVIKEAFPSARIRNDKCEVTIEAEHPAEVAEKARALIEKIRSVAKNRERL
jgi:hypothetical protein